MKRVLNFEATVKLVEPHLNVEESFDVINDYINSLNADIDIGKTVCIVSIDTDGMAILQKAIISYCNLDTPIRKKEYAKEYAYLYELTSKITEILNNLKHESENKINN